MTAEEQFMKYTDPYKKYGDMVLLKINHTLRVKDLCIEIAKSLSLSDEDIELASLCGLLHDIGRFNQWKNNKTFSDMKSPDHGNQGEILLKNNNFINKFTKKNHNTIFRAVKYHNKYSVPKTLNDRNKLFVNITRDADKIDIMYLFVKGELKTKTNNSKITDKVYQSLLDKKLVKKEDIKTKADQVATRLGFVFDLNYKKSFEILKERDYINKLIDIQLQEAENKEFIKQLEDLKIFINKYIGEKITC